ncbi:MAG: hypothetical protein FJ221_15095 [Lentisphaerae bacterium]|nr:hypothetical protein [Lentisphaerota bacterium]
MRNTVAYMAAGLVPNLVNLFILPVYTRFIEPGDYGLVALVVTTTTFLGAFMGLQLTNSIHRLYFDHEGEARRVYCSTMILGILMVNVAILLPLHLAGPWIARTLFPKVDLPYRPLLMLGFAFMFFQNLVNYGNAMLRVQERGRALLVSALIHTTASAGLGLYLVVGRGLGAAGLLTSMAAASAAHAAAHGDGSCARRCRSPSGGRCSARPRPTASRSSRTASAACCSCTRASTWRATSSRSPASGSTSSRTSWRWSTSCSNSRSSTRSGRRSCASRRRTARPRATASPGSSRGGPRSTRSCGSRWRCCSRRRSSSCWRRRTAAATRSCRC